MSTESLCILSLLSHSQRGISTQQVAKDCGVTKEKALSALAILSHEHKTSVETWNAVAFWRITSRGKAELELEQRVYEDDVHEASV